MPPSGAPNQGLQPPTSCAQHVLACSVDGAAVSTVYEGAAQWTFGSSSESSRRLDEYQFTFGEGPCIDAVTSRKAVLVPDLDAQHERRWPVFAEAMLGDGFRSVFALPIVVAATCVGALDLFRADPDRCETTSSRVRCWPPRSLRAHCSTCSRLAPLIATTAITWGPVTGPARARRTRVAPMRWT